MEGTSEKYRVLLVEDNPGDARLVKEFLRDDVFESFSLHHVENMQSALQDIPEQKPQVVLLDLGLPDTSGIATLSTLTRHHPDLPIVVLTGHDQEELGVNAVKQGAEDYLSKNAIDGRLLVRALHFAIQRKANEAHMRKLLRHDLLTELPNRRALKEELRSRIAARDSQQSIGLIYINLDRFKLLNESYGHQVADEVLRLVGQRLAKSLRKSDFIARVERDEFAILTPLNASAEAPSLTAAAERMLALIAREIELQSDEGRLKLQLTGSLGLASHTMGEGHKDKAADNLIANAETAMKKAKQAGGNHYHFYDQKLATEARQRIRIASGLQNALRDNEFALHFQPILDVSGNSLFGLEVLLRWYPGSGEAIPPDAFIPILEESFQIVSVGEWVMNEASQQYRRWVDQGLLNDQVRLFLNLSPRQFVDTNLESVTRRIQKEHHIVPGIMHYEVTENLLLDNTETILERLHHLKSLGINIAIDDFGTGFSSMNYLKDMPCDFLKIDRAFVTSLPDNDRNRVIASAIVHLGASLGIGVIAEGVESKTAADQLIDWGCNIQQGYYYGRPMAAKDFESWWDQREATSD